MKSNLNAYGRLVRHALFGSSSFLRGFLSGGILGMCVAYGGLFGYMALRDLGCYEWSKQSAQHSEESTNEASSQCSLRTTSGMGVNGSDVILCDAPLPLMFSKSPLSFILVEPRLPFSQLPVIHTNENPTLKMDEGIPIKLAARFVEAGVVHVVGDSSILPNDERMHHYQRRRASITELGL